MIRKKKPERLTFIIVPETTAETRTFSVPLNLIKLGIVIISLILIIAVAVSIDYIQSRKDLAQVKAIKAENQQKTREIKDLSRRMLELEKQNQQIDEQQAQIKKLIGGAAPSSDRKESPSRGGARIRSQADTRDLLIQTVALKVVLDDQKSATEQLLDLALSKGKLFRSIPNLWPVIGEITSEFGWRSSPFRRRRSEFHNGLDIAAPRGSIVRAAADGVVVHSGWAPIYGRLIKIRHKNGLITWYGHNAKLLVEEGDIVTKGQPISQVGSSGRSTGPHVHFIVEKNGQPIDPLIYLP